MIRPFRRFFEPKSRFTTPTPNIISFEGQSVDISIPPEAKKIGVNLSGGADSSIVFYAIVHYIKHNMPDDVSVSLLTCANDAKHRWNARKSANVIDFVIRTLEFDRIDMHYTYYRDIQHVTYFHDIEEKLFAEKRIDMIASGLTQMPLITGNTTVTDIHGKLVDLRDFPIAGRERPDNIIWTDDKKYWQPVSNVDKKMIAHMYDHYGVRDTLFPLTRSCEMPPKDVNIFEESFEHTPCGECWWCLERKWAFGEF